MIKLIFLKIKRECFREIYVFLSLFLLCTVLFISIWLNDSIKESKEKAYDTIRCVVELEYDADDTVLPQNKLLQLDAYMKKKDCIRGISSSAGGFANALNFKTIKKYSGSNPYKQTDENEYWFGNNAVVVSGDYAIQLTEDFENKSCSLYKGRYPEDGEAIISRKLAENNQLKIGDILILENYYKKKISLQISGIYNTEGIFVVDKNNSMGQRVFVFSPYNYIYTSLNTGCRFEETEYSGNIKVHYENYHQYQEVFAWIQKTPKNILNLQNYEVVDYTAVSYAGQLGQINAMEHLTGVLTCIIGIIVIGLWSVFAVMYMTEWQQEQILLRLLGNDKKRDHVFKLMVSAIYCIPTVLLGIMAGRRIYQILLNWIFAKTRYEDTSVISSFINEQKYILKKPDVSNQKIWIIVAVVLLFVLNVINMHIREKRWRKCG